MTDKELSIISGPPLSEEPGLGALTLSGFIREVTQQYGPNEALVMHDGSGVTRWTYDELWDRSVEVASSLIALGVGKGTRVGIMMTNRPEFLSAVFGTALAGGVATTISTFSTPAELEYLIEVSGCSVLLFERKVMKKDFADVICALDADIGTATSGEYASVKFPFLRHLAMVGGDTPQGAIETWQDFLDHGAQVAPELVDATSATVMPSDQGVLFFSSGTTSRPKGIMSAHRGVTLQLWRWRKFFATKDSIGVRMWSANGFFWSGNFAMAIGGALSSGGSLVLQATFQPEEALALMEKEKATQAVAWPHQWAQLEAARNWNDVDLSSLYYVGPQTPLGKHLTVKTDWQEPMAAYGNTETFTISAIFHSGTPEDRIAGSHGEPLHGNIFKIIDPLTGEITRMGERGEIAVKGPTMMLGYLGIPLDETLDSDGFFHTGDGGYVDATGRLFWQGRLNDIIKTGGANVSPVEIDTLLKTCPGVKVTQTVGVPHETLGELVVGCIVLHEGATLDEEAIRNFAKEQLASYKVPRRILFFTEDELQMTGTAKVKTADLRILAAKKLEMEPA